MAELMQEYASKKELNLLEGVADTEVSGVRFYRSSTGNKRSPLLYQSGIIILGQGYKNIFLGTTCVTYGPNDYLVVGVPLPLECEAFSDEGKPLLGLVIDIDYHLLMKLVTRLEDQGYVTPCCDKKSKCGLRSVSMEGAMLETCKRLMRALNDDFEAVVIGESILEEICYRVLTSPEGYVLFDLAHQDGQFARVAKALSRVYREYDQPLTVGELAEEANMSVSAFHQAFRNVTFESPLQYLKKIRLDKARELIQVEGKRVSDAARLVGYTSPSQFSREYKRHFNETPKGVIKGVA